MLTQSVLDSTDAPPDRAAVACRALTKDFGRGEAKTRVLRGVDLDVLDGELTLLVGPSGCGKTTLISIIAGLLEPTGGSVRVLGRDLGAMSPDALVDLRASQIGFVFQQYNLLPALTAAENAGLPLVIAGRPWDEAAARGRAMLEAVDLGHKADSRPSELSGGQQQRVAIARALAGEPSLLVCDEPTAALDAGSGRTAMELIRRVAVGAGRAVIVVTHDSRVFDFGDRIVEMADGQVVARTSAHVS